MNHAAKCLAWVGVVASLAWQVRQPDTPLIRWLAPLLQAQQVLAKAAGVTVSQTELDLALQQHLWRCGESLDALPSAKQAEARSTVIRALIDQKLVRQSRGPSEANHVIAATQNEVSQFTRMLAFDEGRRQVALNAALHTEHSFGQSIDEALLDERWLDQRVSALVPEDQVAQWYEAHREQQRMDPAYHAAHLFLSRHEVGKPDRSAEMRQLAAQLASGAGWPALVSEHSEDERTRQREGDLGWFAANRMPMGFMAGVQALRPGQISTPVQTSLGWHLIKLIEIKPERVPELAEMKAEIAAMLGNHQREQLSRALLERLRQGQTPTDRGLSAD